MSNVAKNKLVSYIKAERISLFRFTSYFMCKLWSMSFLVEQKMTSNMTYIGRITSPASFDTTFVGKIFMLDCPSLKLGNC